MSLFFLAIIFHIHVIRNILLVFPEIKKNHCEFSCGGNETINSGRSTRIP